VVSSFLSDKKGVFAQFARFLIVGILNTVFGFACFAILILLGLSKGIALAIAWIFGVLFNFQTIGRLVFNNSRPHLLFRFSMGYLAMYVVNLVALNALVGFGVAPIPAQAMLAPFVAILTFFVNRMLVFRTAPEGP
jgi:putative flippase GtrA